MGKKVLKLFLETMLRAAVIVLGICVVVMLVLVIKNNVKNKKNKENKTTTESSTEEISTDAVDTGDKTFVSSDDDSNAADDFFAEELDDENGGDGSSKDAKDAKVLVINSTGTAGVAGSWKSLLEGDGYSSVEVGNYLAGNNSTTQICAAEGIDISDLEGKFNSPTKGDISNLSTSDFDMNIGDYDVIVIVGTSDIRN